MLRRTSLQKQILLRLAKVSEPSITSLAQSIVTLRPSVSRSLKLLKTQGLVCKNNDGWRLTDEGRKQAVTFFSVASDIEWSFGDLMIGFYCPCGIEVSMANEDEEDLKQCECGRVYRFTCIVESTLPQPNNRLHTNCYPSGS